MELVELVLQVRRAQTQVSRELRDALVQQVQQVFVVPDTTYHHKVLSVFHKVA
jgi:hypothetical protein